MADVVPPGRGSKTKGRPRDPRTGRLLPGAVKQVVHEGRVPAALDVSHEDEVRQAVDGVIPETEVPEAECAPTDDDEVLGDTPILLEPEVMDDPEPLSQEVQVRQLLTQALGMARRLGLVEEAENGVFTFAEVRRNPRKDSSCDCAQCSEFNQLHWFCYTCQSGPHDWETDKPRHERIALMAGGVAGVRYACCTDQCARDYLASVSRQPQPRPVGRQLIDPTLALPG
jgi:hypothetical protein